MIILNLQVITVLAAALFAGCEFRESAAAARVLEIGKSEITPKAPEGLKVDHDAKGKYATVNGLKM
jgi:hypothetical protein